MKRLLMLATLLPSLVIAHPGGAHSHPEELTGGLILLMAIAGAYFLWKKK